MSSLLTIFVIVILSTVVYNESQFITDTDYQDDHERIIAKNPMPFKFCDLASKKPKCEKSNMWREFLKNAYVTREDDHDFSHENVHDYVEDEDVIYQNHKTDQKRNSRKGCITTKSVVKLGPDYHPRFIANITCDNNATQPSCGNDWSCQPLIHKRYVLSKHTIDNTMTVDLPNGCWHLKEIPIHIGCGCGVDNFSVLYET